jgi:hypothetical protein
MFLRLSLLQDGDWCLEKVQEYSLKLAFILAFIKNPIDVGAHFWAPISRCEQWLGSS